MKINKNKNNGNVILVAMITLVVMSIITFVIWLSNSNNPQTPAGYVGYLTKEPFFGSARFYGLQTGPTSSGLTWRLYVKNVSITPYNYDETFDANQGTGVLSKDNLNVSFAVHLIWKVRADFVKNFFEKYSTLGKGERAEDLVRVAYNNYLKEPLRTFARDEVQQLDGLDIKANIDLVGKNIQTKMLQLTKDTPFEVDGVVIGNIQYPAQIANAVADKLAATQELQQRTTRNLIAEMDAKRRFIDAEGIAKAMDIVQQKLTPMYLQHEAIEAQKAMVGSPNHTTIYIPVGNNGVPLVQTINK